MNNQESQVKFNWPPLESDPEIFTQYAIKLGLPDNFSFKEIYSLNYKECQAIDTPVLALIVSYERIKGSKLERNEENFLKYTDLTFYMKQTEALDNACGVIAINHSLLNNLINLNENSILSKFFSGAKNLSDLEKAKFLETDNDFKIAHESYASQGQSNLCENQESIRNHFVAFINFNGNLVELDGLLNGPYIIKKDIKNEEFLDEALKEIESRLNNQLITENLALMYLTTD